MSSIAAGTTTTTGYVVTSDTTGALVLKTGSSATTAVTIGSDQSVTFAGSQTFSGGTANGVLYLNGSKAVTSGSALVFDGTNLGIGTSSPAAKLESFITSTSTPALRLRYNSSSYYADHLMDGNGNYIIKSPTANGVTSGNIGIQAGGVIQFFTNGNTVTDQMRLDASGNLGLGVTPSAWSSGKAVEVGNYGNAFWNNGASENHLTTNAYYNSGWKFGGTGYAQKLTTASGQYQFNVSTASGTAGNAITFTQAMTLDASGNLALGTTSVFSGTKFTANGTVQVGYVDASNAALQLSWNGASSYGKIQTFSSSNLAINPDGNNVGIGTTVFQQRFMLAGNQRFYNTASDGVTNSVVGQIDAQFRNYGAGIATNNLSAIQFCTDPTYYYKGDIRFLTNGSDSTASASTERMRINSAGQITTPYQPVFQAYGLSSGVSGTYLVFQNTYVNIGGHYSTSTGRFTAPIAGTYRFWWTNIASTTADVYRYFLYKNGANYNDSQLRFDTVTGKYGTNGAMQLALPLSAGDYVQIYFTSDNSNASYIGGSTSSYPNFGGELIG